MIIVAVPMVVNSLSSLWAGQIADAARIWLGDESVSQVTDVSLQQRTALVHVLSPEKLPPVDELQSAVDDLVPWHPEVVIVHTYGGRFSE